MTVIYFLCMAFGFILGAGLMAWCCSITPGFRWKPVIRAWWASLFLLVGVVR